MGAICGKGQQGEKNYKEEPVKLTPQQIRRNIQLDSTKLISEIEGEFGKNGRAQIGALFYDEKQQFFSRIQGEVGDELQQDNADCDQIREKLIKIDNDYSNLLTMRTEQIEGILERVNHQHKDLQECKKIAGDKELECAIYLEDIEMIEPVLADLRQQTLELQQSVTQRPSRNQAQEKERNQMIAVLNDLLVDLAKWQNQLTTKMVQSFKEKINITMANIQTKIVFSDSSTQNVLDCVDEMEGNESDQYEEDLYESIQDETNGIVLGNKHNDRKYLEIDRQLEELLRSFKIEMILSIYSEAQTLSAKLDEEKKIIDSKIKIVCKNTYQKACKRDEEFEQVASLLSDLDEQLNVEIDLIAKEKAKLKLRLDNLWGGSTKDNLNNIFAHLVAYQEELNALLTRAREADEQRFAAFVAFDEKVPGIVVQERVKRGEENYIDNPKEKYTAFQNRAKINRNPSDMRSLVNAATKQRSILLELKEQVVELQMCNATIGDKYTWLEKCLEQLDPEPYIPEQGDMADEHLAQYINEAGIDLDVKRISSGVYEIGSEKVNLNVINDNLAVRTGGGFTNAQAFLERHKQRALGTKEVLRDVEKRSGSVASARARVSVENMHTSQRASILSSADGKQSEGGMDSSSRLPPQKAKTIKRMSQITQQNAPPKPPLSLNLRKQRTSVNLLKRPNIDVLEPKKHASQDQNCFLKLPEQSPTKRQLKTPTRLDGYESTSQNSRANMDELAEVHSAALSHQNVEQPRMEVQRASQVSGLKQPTPTGRGRNLRRTKTLASPFSIEKQDSTDDHSSPQKLPNTGGKLLKRPTQIG